MITLLDIQKAYDHIVIPCSSVKLPEPAPAKDFYCGGYFLHQLRIAKVSGLPHSILSTKYGLIPTNFICHPYDLIWSRKVQHDNKSMRGRLIPTSTEEHRQAVARYARETLKDKRVLSFCSIHYWEYFPNWHFFNALIKSRGIQHSVKEMYRIYKDGSL